MRAPGGTAQACPHASPGPGQRPRGRAPSPRCGEAAAGVEGTLAGAGRSHERGASADTALDAGDEQLRWHLSFPLSREGTPGHVPLGRGLRTWLKGSWQPRLDPRLAPSHMGSPRAPGAGRKAGVSAPTTLALQWAPAGAPDLPAPSRTAGRPSSQSPPGLWSPRDPGLGSPDLAPAPNTYFFLDT